MTYRRRSIVIAIVIVLLLSSVVYFVLDARDRCHASVDNTTGDSIPYPVKISIVNSEMSRRYYIARKFLWES